MRGDGAHLAKDTDAPVFSPGVTIHAVALGALRGRIDSTTPDWTLSPAGHKAELITDDKAGHLSAYDYFAT